MAYGLEPIRQANGGTIRNNNFVDGNGYRIAATAPSAYFEGDTVSLSSGLLVQDIGSGDLGAIVGVFWGAEYVDNSSGDVKFVRSIAVNTVAKAQFKAYVYDDPSTIFKIQADQAGTALTSADVGAVVQNLTGSGSTVTFKAGSSLDSSTASNTQNATQQAYPFQIIGSAETDLSYSALGTTMDVLVKINTHSWGRYDGNFPTA
jgi:hypothetical protein|tara:strand:+ start:560 stop:1171 length:612 start_codon:yes stop_codon:yes gene_type:complete